MNTIKPKYIMQDGVAVVQAEHSQLTKIGPWIIFGYISVCLLFGVGNAGTSILWAIFIVVWVFSAIRDGIKNGKRKREVAEILRYQNYGMDDVK